MTAKEHELGQRLQEKENEILELRACYEEKISQKQQELQSLLDDRAAWKKAVEKRERDMRELSNDFQGRLRKNHHTIEQMRRRYETDLNFHRNQQENSKLLERDAEARARVLQESLTTAEEELKNCRNDLFRTLPVCQISDASIVDAFESLGDQVVIWIEDQDSAFDCATPDFNVDYLFSNGKDLKVANCVLNSPSAGEYVCRHIINGYLLERTLGRNIRLFGLPAEYTHMLATIESGMGALRPPRGTRS